MNLNLLKDQIEKTKSDILASNQVKDIKENIKSLKFSNFNHGELDFEWEVFQRTTVKVSYCGGLSDYDRLTLREFDIRIVEYIENAVFISRSMTVDSYNGFDVHIDDYNNSVWFKTIDETIQFIEESANGRPIFKYSSDCGEEFVQFIGPNSGSLKTWR